jgi:2'-5' RNA ligase
MVRCFIGVRIPENLISKIIAIQNSLKNLPLECKLVEPENLHISLSFLGETEEKGAEEISKTLELICSNYEKFELKIGNFLFIPNENYIRVLALDAKDSGVIRNIGLEIKQRIGGDVKPPHLTLCRIKQIKDKQKTIEKIKEINTEIGSFVVTSINLIKSELRRSGPIYTDLFEARLK